MRKYVVVPPMEGGLEHLRDIASNLWFAWNMEAVELFDYLDEDLWDETHHNPQQVLIRLSTSRFNEIRRDEGYRSHAEKVRQRFRAYMRADRAYDYHLEHAIDFTTAYFSLEFGLTECLPIYSGGLGLLAGDHLKSASDLNLPLVGVGLLYKEGYFNQKLAPDGWQEEIYVPRELDTLPLERQTDAGGQPMRVTVALAGEVLLARVLKAQVGRVPLYLLDADIPENPPHLRGVTARLYGGDEEMRIRQEILLGVGGCRALDALGIQPAVYHLNEGHAAFTLLERFRRFVQDDGLSHAEARELVVAQGVLTIHTPVPAGNDVFDRNLMRKYFSDYVTGLGVNSEVFLGLGRKNPLNPAEGFCMTVLGLKLTSWTNGVSKLHSGVAKNMWREVWPMADPADVPIEAITNGVHIPSHISRDMAALYDRYLGPGWDEDPDNEKVWRRADQIPDTELWRTHERCRSRLVYFARRRLQKQLRARGAAPEELERAEKVLDPEALTVCFGRRFATYKRAVLLFRDPDRLKKILDNPDRPMQLIFAGKAHPADNAGKEMIRRIISITKETPFRDRIVFIEDYDMNVARYMVQGADIWLNTPRRPLEACGTSGMKAAANGALNLSVLDGWWDEGYLGDNGWAIGRREEYQDPAYQDEIESHALYDLLQESVKPLFYDRGVDDLPREWISMMKRSVGTICPVFNAHRMVSDYVEKVYVPAALNYAGLVQNNYSGLRQMVAWKTRLAKTWGRVAMLSVEVKDEKNAVKGKELEVSVTVDAAGNSPDDLRVDLLHGAIDVWDNFKTRLTTRLLPESAAGDPSAPVKFTGLAPLDHSGLYGYVVRITPEHPHISSSQRFELVKMG